MKNKIFSSKVILFTSILATFYTLLVIYLMNYKLVLETLTGNFSLSYKTALLLNLLAGMWTAMTGIALIMLIITAILTGINLTLVFQRFSLLYSSGRLHLSLGGSILGLIGSGCAACGLPILALLGLSGSLIYLPLRGTEISILAVVLLGFSFYSMVKTNNEIACRITLASK